MIAAITNAVSMALVVLSSTSGQVLISGCGTERFVSVNKGKAYRVEMSPEWMKSVETNGYVDLRFSLASPFHYEANKYAWCVYHPNHREHVRNESKDALHVMSPWNRRTCPNRHVGEVEFTPNKRLSVKCVESCTNTVRNSSISIDYAISKLLAEKNSTRDVGGITNITRKTVPAVGKVPKDVADKLRGKVIAGFDKETGEYYSFQKDEVDAFLNSHE